MSLIDRLTKEKFELDEKINKLRAFIRDGNKKFDELPMVDVGKAPRNPCDEATNHMAVSRFITPQITSSKA